MNLKFFGSMALFLITLSLILSKGITEKEKASKIGQNLSRILSSIEEFEVSIISTYPAIRPSILRLERGRKFAICWYQRSPPDLLFMILCKIYHANGTNISDVFPTNYSVQLQPQLISWTTFENEMEFYITFRNSTGSGNKITLKTFTNFGVQSRSEIVANPIYNQNYSYSTSIAMLNGSSKIVLVWLSTLPAMIFTIIRPNGTIIVPEYPLINNESVLAQTVVSLCESKFIIAWSRNFLEIGPISYTYSRLYFKIFDENGLNLTNELTLNATTFSNIAFKIIDMPKQKNFIIAWNDQKNLSSPINLIYFQIFDYFGMDISNIETVPCLNDSSFYNLDISLFQNGSKLIITYVKRFISQSYNLGAQYIIYDLNKFEFITEELSVSELNKTAQVLPTVTSIQDSRKFVITWGTGFSGIKTKIFSPCEDIIFCEKCFDDLDCGPGAPVCVSNQCLKSEIYGIISTNGSQIFETDFLSIKLDVIYTFPANLSNTFLLSCQRKNSSSSYEACPDYLGVFDTFKTTEIFIIPSPAFNNSNINYTDYNFTVTVSNKYNSTSFSITTRVFNKIKFGFSNYPYYTKNYDFSIYAYPIDSNSQIMIASFNYIWDLSPKIAFLTSSNKITIPKNSIALNKNNPFLSLIVKVIGSNYQFTEYLTIPINFPPENGSLIITPSNGSSLMTQYKISAENCIDIDMPLKYKFSYYYSPQQINALRDADFSSEIATILPSNTTTKFITIRLEVFDFYEAYNIVENLTVCETLVTDLLQSNAFIGSVLDSLLNTNMTSNQQKLALQAVSSQILNLENQFQTSSNSSKTQACPQCSGHGKCTSNLCQCDSGWSYFDCSISNTVMNQILDSKLRILDSLQSLLANPSNLNDSSITNSLKLIGSNPDFNSQGTYSKIQDILETNLKVSDSNTVLSKTQAEDVSKVVDSTFQYLSYYDCNANSSLANNTAFQSASYINTIGRSIMTSDLNKQNASLVNQGSYSLYVTKMSACKLNSTLISTGDKEAPDVVLKMNDTSLSRNCSKMINVQYVVMNSNLMSCNLNAAKIFSNVALTFYDSDDGLQLNLLNSLSLRFKNISNVVCDVTCFKIGLQCDCSDLSLFDVKSQFLSLFKKSQLKYILKFDALATLSFVRSAPFWVIFVYIVLMAIFLLYLKRIREFDITENVEMTTLPPIRRKFYIYSAAQSFFSIIYFADNIPKMLRGYLYYARIVVTTMHVSIFGLKEYKKNETLSENIQNFSWFNPYLLLLPYITILPSVALFQFLLNKTWSFDQPREKKIGKFISVVFITIVLITCNIFIIVITSNLGSEMQRQWVFNFGLLQVQDFFVYPLVNILLYFLKIKLIMRMNPIQRRKFNMVLNNVDNTILKLKLHGSPRRNSVIKRSSKRVSDLQKIKVRKMSAKN